MNPKDVQFPPSILQLLRRMAGNSNDSYQEDALVALKWIAACRTGHNGPGYMLTLFFKNPFDPDPKHYCYLEALPGTFSDGVEGWGRAQAVARRMLIKKERRCPGNVIAASLRHDPTSRLEVFQPADWGARNRP